MRIVSLSPSVTEVIYALNSQDNLVGVTEYCDFPPGINKPIMGGWMNIDFDKVLAQRPDIVFTSTVVQEKVKLKALDLGLNVVHLDPRTLNEVFESFLTIGEFIGKPAHDYVKNLKLEFEKYRGSLNKNIYVEEWPNTVSCNWVPDMIELVGGKSLGKSGVLSHKIDNLKGFNPDHIIISWCGFGTKVPLEKIKLRLNEFKEKIIVADDSFFNRPGPRLLEGVKLLASL